MTPRHGIDPELLRRLAPGTGIRDALDRIRRGRTGALIVLGHGEAVRALCDGGFVIDAAFTPTRLRELCKMDGAVVLSADGAHIHRANVHLTPDRSVPTEESGTRHRSAERTSAQAGVPVIAVSQSMDIVTVYDGGARHVLTDSAEILARANQALATIGRYRARLDEEEGRLFAAELHGFASAGAAAGALRLAELLRRTGEGVARDVVELGDDGHALGMQLDELLADVGRARRLLLRDYLVSATGAPSADEIAEASAMLAALDDGDLVGAPAISRVLGFPGNPESLDEQVDPRGYRALARVPRMPEPLMDRIVDRFVTLPALLDAGRAELAEVPGLGPMWAGHIRQGLDRLAHRAG
ncbi:DNA integrity scanning diadenylate cyclase DisA [Corynebacterium sp.]|uniref:DNA integrity scanning diadenylate cyclase DisA n=1 Tax=Corynebacterium sp. TaxID=1720 RepID=UPI0026DDA343|nr:DNA integrity scanning diadenylate cyclase DisA [Corynebacterium sp.]MDO4609757.1 DNA integrity scanning diadenylate cyclase DisA [Corynebacterium sp.]